MITEPEPRKSSALKKAWVIKWNTAATYPPIPSAATMYPNWLMVEKASTRLMSSCATAITEANRAVKAPVKAITPHAGLPCSTALSRGKIRASRKMPAETIVAAWMRALTGVGPSIASGNHTCSGN